MFPGEKKRRAIKAMMNRLYWRGRHFGQCAFAKSDAFTLVELLVVIAIIALLLAMLLPALSRARDQAKKVKCASQLKQFGIGLAMYAQDNKNCTPKLMPGDSIPNAREDVKYGYCIWYGDPGYAPDSYKFGLGKLIPGIISVDKMATLYYCPSQTDPSHMLNGQNKDIAFKVKWGQIGGTNPYVVIGYFERQSKKMTDRTFATLADMFYAGHNRTGHRPRGDNVLYSDGAVLFFKSEARWDPGAFTHAYSEYPADRNGINSVWAIFDAKR